ncbi:hypothetical protein DHODJN_25955 [Methylorubrum extorquens]
MRFPLAASLVIALSVTAEAADYLVQRKAQVVAERMHLTPDSEYFASPSPPSCDTVVPAHFLVHADPRPRFGGYAICTDSIGVLYGYTTIDPDTRRITQYREVPPYPYR